MNAFISYRRAEQDVGIAAWGLAQTMKQHGWTVFMDLEIPPLADWKRILREAVEQSSIMLVAIGPHWTALLNERRETGAVDWVRFEIATALAREIPIGPVLFGGARLPIEIEMPEDVRMLVDRQAVELTTSSPKEFDRDCNAFVAQLNKHYARARSSDESTQTPASKDTTQVLNPSPALQLVNTTWKWPSSKNTTVTFKSNGTVTFSDTEAIGYWDLKGDHLQFDCNRFTMFDVVVKGNSMKGEWYRIGNKSKRNETSLEKVHGGERSA